MCALALAVVVYLIAATIAILWNPPRKKQDRDAD